MDLSHMHQGKLLFDVLNDAATQHYSAHIAKVAWGLWVLGLHEEHTSLEPRMTYQAPYRLYVCTMTIDPAGCDHDYSCEEVFFVLFFL